MKLPGFKARERWMFVICIALVVIFGAYQFLAKPILEETEMIDQKIELQENKLKKNLDIIQKGKVVDAQFDELFNLLGEKAGDEAELVSSIETAAAQAQINITNMQPQKAISRDSYKIFSVNLVMEGKWRDIMKFLYVLENAPHFCQVQQITLEKNSVMADTVRGRLTIGKLRVTK